MKESNEFSLFEKASYRAQKANYWADKGRKLNEQSNSYNKILKTWDNILMNAPVVLFTTIFIICGPIEILVSYEMYHEILTSYSESPAPVFIWMLGAFIIGTGALVSHQLSKSLSPELFDWEVSNLQLFTSGETQLIFTEAREIVKKHTLVQTIIGVIGFLVLISTVGFISWQRSILMAAADGIEDYSLFEKLLPIIIVIVEVYTGTYIVFLLKKVTLIIQKNSVDRNLAVCLKNCVRETEMAYLILEKTNMQYNHLELNKNLIDVFHRVSFRSSSTPEYLAEVNIFHCIFNIEAEDGPVPNLRIQGFFGNSKLTSPSFTNIHGKAILIWDHKVPLAGIDINRKFFEGPFQQNGIYKIQLDEKKQIIANLPYHND